MKPINLGYTRAEADEIVDAYNSLVESINGKYMEELTDPLGETREWYIAYGRTCEILEPIMRLRMDVKLYDPEDRKHEVEERIDKPVVSYAHMTDGKMNYIRFPGDEDQMDEDMSDLRRIVKWIDMMANMREEEEA